MMHCAPLKPGGFKHVEQRQPRIVEREKRSCMYQHSDEITSLTLCGEKIDESDY